MNEFKQFQPQANPTEIGSRILGMQIMYDHKWVQTRNLLHASTYLTMVNLTWCCRLGI